MLYVDGVGIGSQAYLASLHPDTTATTSHPATATQPANAAGVAPKVSKPGPVDWSKVPGGEVTYEVAPGDSLWDLATDFYGSANAETIDNIALANPTQFHRKTPLTQQSLEEGATLTILSPERADEIRTVEQDYATVESDETAVATAQGDMSKARGMVEHGIAYQSYTTAQSTLTAAQTKLKTALQPLLLPDPTQGYTANVGDAQATQLESILPEAGLQPYINTALHSLQGNLDKIFGNPADPHSLRADITSGNWTAAEHVEQQEIAAAGKGIANTAQRQTAMALYVQQVLLTYGPQTTQYRDSLNQAFDAAAVQPMVAALNNVYANGNGSESYATAFAAAFKQDMASSIPLVQTSLLHDLLAEPNSPLLQVAQQIRAASNQSLPSTTPYDISYERQYGHAPANSVASRYIYPTVSPNLWQISSAAELSQTYQDLAGGVDLAAIGDTVGTGTGMIHQVAQAILGNPKSGGANLQALMPAIKAAAAGGNVNLSAEMALILAQPGQPGGTTEASAVLDSAAQGVAQLQVKIEQDYTALRQLPQELQIPVESVGALFSDTQTTVKATTSLVAGSPSLQSAIKSKFQQDLQALDADGQAVARVDAAVTDLSPALLTLAGTADLQVARNNLTSDPSAVAAVALSPSAQSQLGFEAQQQAFATAIVSTIPGQDWTTPRGLPYLPPGVLWVGRDVTAYVEQSAAGGLSKPFGFLSTLGVSAKLLPNSLNFNLTANVAQEINSAAQAMGGGAPVNIEALQAEITAIKNRSVVLSFGTLKTPTPAATKEIEALQKILDADPRYQQIQVLTRKLALTNNPVEREALTKAIAAENAASVEGQIKWMKALASSDPQLAAKIGGLEGIEDLGTRYAAAQKIMANINATTAATQVPPSAASIDSWLNRAGQLVKPGTELDKTLKDTLSPATYTQLTDGKLADPLTTLPEEAIAALQGDTAITKAIGKGPATGLLPTTLDGTAFSMLDLVEKFGGAAYLYGLGDTRSDPYNLYKQFGAALAFFSGLPSLGKLAGSGVQQLIGKDLSSLPAGDWLTGLLQSGGSIDTASLFAIGIGNSSWAGALGTLSGIAWTPMMYEWAAQEFQAHQPINGLVIGAVGSSYLLPLIFAESAWAGPVSAAIDIVGILYILGNTLYEENKAINRYTPAIQQLLTKAGVTAPGVAAALAQPDSQGLAAVVRLGQVFNSVPYYNDPSNPQVADQRRLAYLNSLNPEQAYQLSQALLKIPVGTNGSIAATGKVDLYIPPPPKSMSPTQVEAYYNQAYREHHLQPPPSPSQLEKSVQFTYVPENEFADYYGYYTDFYAANGWFPSNGGPWNESPGGLAPSPYPPSQLTLMSPSIQGFLYYADALGVGLKGVT
jgi:hypothetical protein